jgi:hypothetical protein
MIPAALAAVATADLIPATTDIRLEFARRGVLVWADIFERVAT